MARRTIKVKNYANIMEEKDANAAITPGMLIQLMSTDKVRAHADAGLNVLPMFACEDELQGKSIDDAYAADDKVQVWVPNRGDIVLAILADGENVTIGDDLESDGAGMLKKHTIDGSASGEPDPVYGNQIVGQAVEAVDISDSSGGESSGDLGYDKRIKVRIY